MDIQQALNTPIALQQGERNREVYFMEAFGWDMVIF